MALYLALSLPYAGNLLTHKATSHVITRRGEGDVCFIII